MKTWDLHVVTAVPGTYVGPQSLEPGSFWHCHLIDLLSACRGGADERVLQMRLSGMTQEDIAFEMYTTRWSVGRILARLYRVAGRLRISDMDRPQFKRVQDSGLPGARATA